MNVRQGLAHVSHGPRTIIFMLAWVVVSPIHSDTFFVSAYRCIWERPINLMIFSIINERMTGGAKSLFVATIFSRFNRMSSSQRQSTSINSWNQSVAMLAQVARCLQTLRSRMACPYCDGMAKPGRASCRMPASPQSAFESIRSSIIF